jgi:hypothetical protein
MSKRRMFRIGVAGFLAAALAGCGAQSSKAAPAPPARTVLLQSIDLTAAAKTAHMSMTAVVSGAGSASAFAIRADGAADLGTGDSQLTMHLGGAMSGLLAGGIEVRSVGGVAYMRVPSLPSFVAGGKEWFKIDLPKIGTGSDATLGLGSESDPTKFLAYLETVSDGVRDVGPDVVRGVETTHYHADLDLTKAVDGAKVPPALRRKLEQLLAPHSSHLAPIPVDVWVDAQGLVRRIRMQLDLGSFLGAAAAGHAGSAPSVTISIDLFDFGAPVHVVAPPADQVSDLGDLGSAGLGGLQAPTAAS